MLGAESAVLQHPICALSLSMSAKITASRRRAFLTHLANSGNITLSAERAKVSRSWVRLHRSEDPAFDAACREAVAVAKMMLSDDASRLPAGPRWAWHEGCELVVNGTRGRRVQVRRASTTQWTGTQEKRFLAVLAGTANVKASCRAVGTHPPSAYAHRKRWPDFARRWDEAIQIGMCELEARIIQNFDRHFDPEAPEPEVPMEGLRIESAIRTLAIYQRRGRNSG